jgi:glycosyltransferase involved in cell wall biosynthesis
MKAVSVCIFTYNHEKYIEQCIESVLMQKTDFNFEIVLGEDYSTDKTRIICKTYSERYPEKIRLLDRGKNLGMCENVFGTIKEANGDYIAILDGDDYWIHPLKLQKQYDYLESNENINLVFHQTIRINELSNNLSLFVPFEKSLFNTGDLIRNWLMATSAMFFRRKAMDYPSFLSHTHNFDLAIQLIVNKNDNDIGYLNEIMSVYRINQGSNTNNELYNQQNTAKRQLILFKEINEYLNFRFDAIIKMKMKRIEKKLKIGVSKKLSNSIKSILKNLIHRMGYNISFAKIVNGK